MPERRSFAHQTAPQWPRQGWHRARTSLCCPANPRPGAARHARIEIVKVIASQLRKGNIVDIDGKLYVVLTAENFHPGKGTPTTQVDMRRISDGVKTSQRYKTTDQVERAHVEDHEFSYLYNDGEGFHFMNQENYEQIIAPDDIVGDYKAYLQEGMVVNIALHEGTPVSMEIPQKVTLEITDTEPVVKGQTASGSFKPAMLSNGVRTMVPTHIVAGTRVVVNTVDGSYVERAKD
jgi:elongation factor P